MLFQEDRQRWLDLAQSLTPRMTVTRSEPKGLVQPQKDPQAFQGWRMTPQAPWHKGDSVELRPGQAVFFDFGQHCVGFLRLVATAEQSPIHLLLRFGEVPAEVIEDPALHPGKLGGEWLAPKPVGCFAGLTSEFEARRAFQYVRVELADGSPPARLTALWVDEATSAGSTPRPLDPGLAPTLHHIDAVSMRTLRNCMQSVFEDGPKRDRRLWLGDLRLQALANYVTFGNFDLVKRCLYIFAAMTHDDGLAPACVFAHPQWHYGNEFIPDYALLLGPTLLDYVQASGDTATGLDLWPVALRQTEIIHRCFNADGLFTDAGKMWLFIDWSDRLDRQASEQATAIYGLNKLLELGRLLGVESASLEPLARMRCSLTAAARRFLLDETTGLFVSGSARQVSWASQVWMILAGVLTPEEARRAFHALENHPNALRPVTPYLYHHVLDALCQAGLTDQAHRLLDWYWGGMIRLGATTFWEVWNPDDQFLSPYASHLHNSYCHAWSCTPSWFIRTGRLHGTAGPHP